MNGLYFISLVPMGKKLRHLPLAQCVDDFASYIL